ncbi:MAG: MBL fold metallo-hydrolase [Kiritimatiellales bacterium]|nr:MBL fold metallo-hydrolase [Kiritimatiellales bacterium]
MNIKTVVTGEFAVNCYIVWGEQKQALVIDAGFGADGIAATIKAEGLTVAAHLCTHAHTDHINALAVLHRLHPAPIAMHSIDWQWAFNETNQLAPFYPVPQVPAIGNIALESSKDWKFADLSFQCLETPGHTPGSVCLYFPESGNMFTGDTLFKGSCGRTDLPGGNGRQLADSLKFLKTFPDEVRIWPGHGPGSTIGYEKANNFFMMPH